MSVGRTTDIESLGEIPANFVVRGFVPQLEVLQRVCFVICNYYFSLTIFNSFFFIYIFSHVLFSLPNSLSRPLLLFLMEE